MPKLYDIPRGSKIYGVKTPRGKAVTVIFHHLDGAYSYCYIEGHPERVVHYSASMPLKPFKDGYEVGDE